ncbi:MlaA family lipoprotein [Sulfurovum mangrovi]|uniref:MlaA family lipoprotein n=1 Tax=Sulfurovum mangrovi TaxID=2893889 RepID=UPI001E299A6F|nr:VacJ family lipoprotein [Sulfurovum mangrovi]UFH59074.1 VacJ family lipoprotein [Sulfurovum mangrovi]
MKFLHFFLMVVLLAFQGCATKEVTPDTNHQQLKREVSTPDTLQSDNLDNQLSEVQTEGFEEEFSEEETSNAIDPLSGYNRVMTSFNDKVMIYLIEPVADAYAFIVPQPARIGLSNAIDNIQFPVRFANNLLQLKFENSADELKRFIVNSTIGIGGLMDPATTYMNTPAHNEDFGQTLGHYGMGSGFHIVLPFVGPSNVRDLLGLTADAYISPLVYVKDLEKYRIPNNRDQTAGIYSVDFINKTSLHPGEYESFKKDAIDLYPFFRDTYEQKRNSDIAE